MLLLLGIVDLAAAGPCSLDWVCVRPNDAADGSVAFVAENLKPWPVTVSLRVRGTNLAGTPNPVTMTLPPDESLTMLRMRPRNPARPTNYRYYFDWAIGDRHAAHDDDYAYAFPYQEGKRYRVVQGYGSRFSHTGLEQFTIDFDMPVGTAVHAAREGIVARVVEKHDRGCWEKGCGKFANYIVIMHEDGTTGEYYHLQRNGALVEPGQRVRRGQRIGLSGNTGHTTMPHLHFGVYRASSWGATESIPVRFVSAEGVITTPRRGRGYVATTAPAIGQTADF